MQALKMLLRTWRGGQLSLIIWSLVLAVAVVTSVSILAERIERALTAESSSFLAADLVVRSSRAIDPLWIQEAERQQVRGIDVYAYRVWAEPSAHRQSSLHALGRAVRVWLQSVAAAKGQRMAELKGINQLSLEPNKNASFNSN